MNLTAEGVYGKHVFVPRLDPVYATKAQLIFFIAQWLCRLFKLCVPMTYIVFLSIFTIIHENLYSLFTKNDYHSKII